MNKRTPFRASLIAAALASVAGLAGAAVVDNSGSRISNNAGGCVGNVSGRDCVVPAADATTPAAPSATAPESLPRGDIAALTSDSAPAGMRHPAENGFVTDNTGGAARAGTGGCVTGNTGAAPFGVPECGGILVQTTPPVEVPPAQAVAPEPREIPLRRITLDADTTFNFDSDQLSAEGEEQLDTIVEAAAGEDVARLRIHVTGYADRIGPEEYNRDLSGRRADTVREYFVQAGVPADVISAEGRGEANPIVQCEGMQGVTLVECLRPNRRSEVEFAALERAEAAATEEQPPSESWAPGTDTGTPR